MTTSTKLFLAAAFVVASVGGFWLCLSRLDNGGGAVTHQTGEPALASSITAAATADSKDPAPSAQNDNATKEPKPAIGPDGAITVNYSAANYHAPEDRSLDMQLFDKALFYLMDVQEADGHIDSKKTGAAPEFCTLNNDIAITSIAAWVMMGSSSGANQNKEALAHARKAIQWLESKIQPDGTIADVNATGESGMAQLFASDAFRLAFSYSTRELRHDQTNRLNSVLLLKMKAKNGGYGPDANSVEPRADVLALAAFVYKFAGYDGFKFDAFLEKKSPGEKTSANAAMAIEEEIAANLRAGLKRLGVATANPAAEKPEPNAAQPAANALPSLYSATPGGPADWRATVGGMQAMFLINPARSTVTPALEFVFGAFDKKTESYPRILEHIKWGEKGDGYDAITLWQGSIAVAYMFTEDKYESKTWNGNLRTMLKEHQAPDGSWPAAGEDAKRGRAWRTGLHAMTLALTAPPPPPPAPPPDSTVIVTPAVPVNPKTTK